MIFFFFFSLFPGAIVRLCLLFLFSFYLALWSRLTRHMYTSSYSHPCFVCSNGPNILVSRVCQTLFEFLKLSGRRRPSPPQNVVIFDDNPTPQKPMRYLNISCEVF